MDVRGPGAELRPGPEVFSPEHAVRGKQSYKRDAEKVEAKRGWVGVQPVLRVVERDQRRDEVLPV